MTAWRRATVAPDRTHHLADGHPLYDARFSEVLSFHEPGLAAVAMGDQAWHIDAAGRPAYAERFRRTFGFYEGRAAVAAADGWHHVLPDGSPLSGERQAWCGNFQEGRCAVRDHDGWYFHIDPAGRGSYAQRHLYAGDFRDGIAVVRLNEDGLCAHVDRDGRQVHPERYLDLDVFHKGFARARDAHGWFHVNRDGRPAYLARYENVEPFYNGFALAWTGRAMPVVIDETGTIRHEVGAPAGQPASARSLKLLVIGNIGAGKSTLAAALAARLNWPFVSIDGCRLAVADGSAEGELRAWARLTRAAARPYSLVLECTGVGPQMPLLRVALRESGSRIGVLIVRTPAELCRTRASGRRTCPPYPAFGIPAEDAIGDVGAALDRETGPGGTWTDPLVGVVDGSASPAEEAARAEALVRQWRDA